MQAPTCILIALSCLFIFNTALFAQETNHQFGVVNKADFAITGIKGEENADAVVIYDIGTSRFVQSQNHTGFDVIFDRKTRIKINTKAGFDYGEISIPLYNSSKGSEDIIGIEAFTWNVEEGAIVKTELDKKQIFAEQANASWNLTKFALPNIKEGSVIEFKYSIVSPYLFNLKDWTFQRKIPTCHSEYIVRLTPFYEYVNVSQGIDHLDIHEAYYDNGGLKQEYYHLKYYNTVHRYGMKDVPSFKDESFITSINDYIAKIDFQLSKIHTLDGYIQEIMTDWETVEDDLLEHSKFGHYIRDCKKFTKKIVAEADITDKSEEDKFNFAVDYVKQNFKWNKRHGFYSGDVPKALMKSKEGNNASLNLFLIALLRALELEAYPVILSTRNHGKVFEKYPILDFFNYVIVWTQVDGKWVLTDGTNDLRANDLIPAKCFNGKGLVLGKEMDNKWILLQQKSPSKIQESIDIRLSENLDSVLGNFTVKTTLYDALALKNHAQDDKKALAKIWEEEDIKMIGKVESENYKDRDKNYNLNFTLQTPVEEFDNQLFIAPFFKEPYQENPLKQAVRKYPVDMTYPRIRLYKSQIQIPEGYEVSSLPEAFSVDNDLINIQYNAAVSGDKVKIIGMYQFKKTIYPPQDYKQLKKHFEELIRYFNERVGLVMEQK